MKTIELLIIISAICFLGETKTVRKSIKISNFNKEGPFIFVTKLHIGAGYGQVDLTYTYSLFHAGKETKSHLNNYTTHCQLGSLMKLVSTNLQRLRIACKSSNFCTRKKR